jgi:hypothetical protein
VEARPDREGDGEQGRRLVEALRPRDPHRAADLHRPHGAPVVCARSHQLRAPRRFEFHRLLRRRDEADGHHRGLPMPPGLPDPLGRRDAGAVEAFARSEHRRRAEAAVRDHRLEDGLREAPRHRRRTSVPGQVRRVPVRVRVAVRRRLRHGRRHVARGAVDPAVVGRGVSRPPRFRRPREALHPQRRPARGTDGGDSRPARERPREATGPRATTFP